jgi:hypothetical protein
MRRFGCSSAEASFAALTTSSAIRLPQLCLINLESAVLGRAALQSIKRIFQERAARALSRQFSACMSALARAAVCRGLSA